MSLFSTIQILVRRRAIGSREVAGEFKLFFLLVCLGGGFTGSVVHAGEPSSFTNPVATVAQTNAAGVEHLLVEADVLALLTDALQKNYVRDKGELELRFTRRWTPRHVPDTSLTVKVLELPTAGVTSSFIVRFELLDGGDSLGVFQMPVQAHIHREVWVARSTIKRGTPVGEADIVRERRDIVSLREAIADFSANDGTLEFAESVQTGVPLLARAIKPRTVIRRGQTAEARVQDGALNISLKVEALEDGAPGQVIRIRNPISRRDIAGRVLDERTILIAL